MLKKEQALDKPDYRIHDIDEAWNMAVFENEQRDAIKSGINPSKTSRKSKGNFGEMVADVEMGKEAWVRITKDNYGLDGVQPEGDLHKAYKSKIKSGSLESDSITGFNDKVHHGIDGVYIRTDHNTSITEYCIVEAKYGTSKLGKTSDGISQMSYAWIYHKRGKQNLSRLEKAVGKDIASTIKNADKNGQVEYRMARIDQDREGNPTVVFHKLSITAK